MPSLRLGNQETSYVVQIYNDPEWNETVKELFSNITFFKTQICTIKKCL